MTLWIEWLTNMTVGVEETMRQYINMYKAKNSCSLYSGWSLVQFLVLKDLPRKCIFARILIGKENVIIFVRG